MSKASPLADRYLSELEELGIQRVNVPGTRKMHFMIKCDCGEELTKNYKANMPPEALNRMMRQTGWLLSHRHSPICPGCQKKEKSPVAPKQTEQVPHKSIKDVADNSITRFAEAANKIARFDITLPAKGEPSTIEINPKIARQVYSLLESVFDEAQGRYEKGWSDERIGKQLEVAPNAVEKIRREAYGEIREDPKIVALREDLESLKKDLAKAEEKVLNDATRQIEPLRNRVQVLEKRLAELDA
ncbi:hypothetical protein [Brucella intermedia]|uniref:hypothetical protein n=1 Tax=Brucella intermedia TaxID=94625 RepID=UPI00224B7E67|nr:hypothetical protein [Brucella intermedia]